MSIHKVLLIPPAIILASDAMPDDMAGWTKGPLVKIRPKYIAKNDEGLIHHELTHVLQFWIWFVVGFLIFIGAHHSGYIQLIPVGLLVGLGHLFVYDMSSAYRLFCEVQAYKVQARFYKDDRRPLFAKFISEDYNLDITQPEALKLLCKK